MRFQPRLPAPRVALTCVVILVLSVIGPAPVVQAADPDVEAATTPIQISMLGSGRGARFSIYRLIGPPSGRTRPARRRRVRSWR